MTWTSYDSAGNDLVSNESRTQKNEYRNTSISSRVSISGRVSNSGPPSRVVEKIVAETTIIITELVSRREQKATFQ